MTLGPISRDVALLSKSAYLVTSKPLSVDPAFEDNQFWGTLNKKDVGDVDELLRDLE